LIDYGFHAVVSDPTEAVLREELPLLVEEGIRSVKVYSTYAASFVDDEAMLDVFRAAKAAGALVVVHAESDAMIKWLTRDLARRGLTRPQHHALAKPPVVEREAIHRIIALSELLDQPIQIFHASSAEGVEEIRRAQRRGVKVFAETCPHYLAFTAADLDRPGFEGAKYLCSPALRTHEDQQALWQAIRDGVIGNVSSDHASWDYEGPKGKRVAGMDAPFFDIPNGMPGVETRLPFLFSEGVGKGHIDLNTFVAITATNPARLFGLYPRKGTVAPGADADLVLWDLGLERTVRARDLHGACDYTPFEGMTLTGWPVVTLVRGEIVVAGERLVAKPGWGNFLPRARYAIGH
jgi:dihydropyrimidinase